VINPLPDQLEQDAAITAALAAGLDKSDQSNIIKTDASLEVKQLAPEEETSQERITNLIRKDANDPLVAHTRKDQDLNNERITRNFAKSCYAEEEAALQRKIADLKKNK